MPRNTSIPGRWEKSVSYQWDESTIEEELSGILSDQKLITLELGDGWIHLIMGHME